MHVIHVATEFSDRPFGRYAEHHPERNGTRFRQDWLIPALEMHRKVKVDFTGTHAVGPSFVEEAFGGLIEAGYDIRDLHARLIIHFAPPNAQVKADKVWAHIQRAAKVELAD
jgi:hypothetical protein